MKKIYTVDGMNCTSCALVIESDLEDAGVKARCNYAKGNLEVEFDPVKIKENTIRDVVKKAGYSLKPV